MNNILVVGAGVSGLSAAYELSKYLPTSIIDRLPIIGGTHSSYLDEFTKTLKRKCEESNVIFLKADGLSPSLLCLDKSRREPAFCVE